MQNKPVKILVADDEPLLQSLLLQSFDTQVLNNEWQFIFVKNGLEALQKLEEDPDIGVILTDINMPQMDGLTLLNKLYNHDRLYRSVVVSAYGDMHNIRVAMNLGAADFITKPLDLQDLEITLNKIIMQYQQLKQGIHDKQQNIEITQELAIAWQIQKNFIPTKFNLFNGNQKVDFYGEMIPAKQVGGDFFDIIKLDDDRAFLIVGDVSGKGIPAALFMAMSQTLIHAVALSSSAIEECMKQVNDILSIKNESMMFITCFCAILDVNTGELNYCNGGHPPPFIVSPNGDVQKIGDEYDGIALGINSLIRPEGRSFIFQPHKIQMKPNQTLFIYSDGVTESTNASRELYAENNLVNFLKNNAQNTLEGMVEALKKEITDFAKGTLQSDDITVLVVKYLES